MAITVMHLSLLQPMSESMARCCQTNGNRRLAFGRVVHSGSEDSPHVSRIFIRALHFVTSDMSTFPCACYLLRPRCAVAEHLIGPASTLQQALAWRWSGPKAGQAGLGAVVRLV
jgi:hypothetical protein